MKQRHHSIRRFSIGMWTVALTLIASMFVYGAANFGSIKLTPGSIKFNGERAAPTGGDAKAASTAVLYNDSTTHKLMLSNNNAAYANVLTDAAAGIPDSALSSNVALLNRAAQTFTTQQIVSLTGSTTLASGDQFKVNSLSSGKRAEVHLTDGVTSDAFISFEPSATAASRKLHFTANGSDSDLYVDGSGNAFFGGKITTGGRLVTTGSTPTASIAAGFCTTPSVAVQTGSGDDWGTLRITTGTGCAAATGSVTLTFSTANGAYGTNGVPCTFTPLDAGGAYATGVTWKLTASSTTAQTLALLNGATNWTSSTTYDLHYHCGGR